MVVALHIWAFKLQEPQSTEIKKKKMVIEFPLIKALKMYEGCLVRKKSGQNQCNINIQASFNCCTFSCVWINGSGFVKGLHPQVTITNKNLYLRYLFN